MNGSGVVENRRGRRSPSPPTPAARVPCWPVLLSLGGLGVSSELQASSGFSQKSRG